MIWGKPSKRLGGFELWGDIWDLKDLHDLIHKLCDENGRMPYEVSECVLGFAYEIRKAFDRHRLTNEICWCGEDTKPVYGVELPFVTTLVQYNIMRGCASYECLSLKEQAVFMGLESVVAQVLIDGFGLDGKYLFELAGRMRSGPWEPLLKKLEGRNAYFLAQRTKAERKKTLQPVLRSLDTLYDRLFEAHSEQNGTLIHPDIFDEYIGLNAEFYHGITL